VDGGMKKVFLIITSIIVLIYGGYKTLFPSAHWNQKLTIYFETPNGPVVVKNVVRVDLWYTPVFAGAGGNFVSVKGEALTADLGDRKVVFALLNRQNWLLRQTMFRYGIVVSEPYARNARKLKSQTEPLVVPPELYPVLVSFMDVNDPKYVELINDNTITEIFGDGYEIIKMTVQVTHEPITAGIIEEYLPWWHSLTVQIGGLSPKTGADPRYGIRKWDFLKE
jgi:hypothetical protein